MTAGSIPHGRRIEPTWPPDQVGDALARAVASTRVHAPTDARPPARVGPHEPTFEARDEGAITASLRCVDAGLDTLTLNFASAKHPGGGFLNGARAQEESLCRSSGLFACLEGRAIYDVARALADPLYATWAIHSPRVPVFRGDDGALLEAPREVSFVTSPAPNAKAVLARDPTRRSAVSAALKERIALVLGAWGCGVFGNDTREVAALFDEALRGPFRGAFERVVFAIFDSSPEQRFLGPFAKTFA